jgi:H+/Cl- antiporter ClcA
LFRSLPGTDGGLSLLKRGDYFQLDFSGSILGILILSVLAAVAAAFLIWLCKKTDKEFHQLFNTRRSMDFSPKAFGFRIFLWAIATAAGFYFFSDALGTGANLLQQSQAEQAVIGVLFAGLLLRLILSVLSYTAIGSLGIFLPNLVFGAVMGATLALFLSRWFPLSIHTFILGERFLHVS